MRTSVIFGIISALFGAIALGAAIGDNTITSGGFGIAAGIMGLAAGLIGRDDER
ncbi:hypothetical protein [Bifidobacterium aerophilum]|uniref:hypothetical protein n=1 Tax=Bifidobacterium aerophilum TaxID=1798155 RepID=UPI00195378DF|nr:hypothetical protein [Bifidobacterium aerophilum]